MFPLTKIKTLTFIHLNELEYHVKLLHNSFREYTKFITKLQKELDENGQYVSDTCLLDHQKYFAPFNKQMFKVEDECEKLAKDLQ